MNKFRGNSINYNLDKELAQLVSFITFDGHLHKDLKGFYIVSKDKQILNEFKDLIKRKFGVIGIYEKGTGYGEAYKYRIFNTKISKFLCSIGVPKGDKMVTKFDIPDWVKDNKVYAKEYLKIAFYCEGSRFKKTKNTETIRINLNKSEELLDNGLGFMESLKELLKQFNVESTETWMLKGNKRNKDGKITKLLRFNIKANSNNNFIKGIGWLNKQVTPSMGL